MMGKKVRSERRDVIRLLPGLLVSLVALIVIFLIVDWQEVFTALSQADYQYLFIGVPIYLVAYGFRALAWWTLLNEEVSYKRVFLTMQAGYLLNNLLPFRLGEVGRGLLLGRDGLGFWRVVSTILIERAFDMILAAGLLIGTIPFVFRSPQSGRVAVGVLVIVILGLLALHMLARYRDRATLFFEHLSTRWSLFARFGVERLSTFFDGLSALVQPTRFLRVLVWMGMSWALTIVYQYLLLLAFIPGAKVLWAAFGLGTASLGVALPSSPSYVGVLEAAWIGALAIFDVSFSAAFAYAITAHLIHILVSLVFGVYALSLEGESLGKLYARLRNRSLK